MTILQFPAPQAEPDHVWPPIRQSPGIDLHRHGEADRWPWPAGIRFLAGWMAVCWLIVLLSVVW